MNKLFSDAHGFLKKIDIRVKVAIALGLIISLAVTKHEAWISLSIQTLLIITVTLLNDDGFWCTFSKRLQWFYPFLFLSSLWLISLPGLPLIRLPWGGVITDAGLYRWISTQWKMIASLWVATLLFLNTPIEMVLKALKSFGVSETLLTIVLLTWRYLFVLGDEAQKLLRARAARSSGTLRAWSLYWYIQVTGNMIGNILVRGMERAERVHAAMLSRGFDGTLRTDPLPPICTNHIVSVITFYVVLFLLLIWRV